MYWEIGDYISQKSVDESTPQEARQEYSALLKIILNKLSKLCTDQHAEARHSAIQILTQLIIHNCEKIHASGEFDYIRDMLFGLFAGITQILCDKTAQGEVDVKLWQKTV